MSDSQTPEPEETIPDGEPVAPVYESATFETVSEEAPAVKLEIPATTLAAAQAAAPEPAPESSSDGTMVRRITLVGLLLGLVIVPAYFQHQRFKAREAESAPLVDQSQTMLDEFGALMADPESREALEAELLEALSTKARAVGALPVTTADTRTALDEFAASLEDEKERKSIERRLMAALRQRQHGDAAHARPAPVSLREALSELGVQAEQDQ